jgi:hemerythrin-like domain-containing protein
MTTRATPGTGAGAGAGSGSGARQGTGATAAGRAMVETLLSAHAGLRRDLDSLGEALMLLADGDGSADAETYAEVRARVDELTMRQVSWQLKSFCDHYCQTVHLHHSIEDVRIFPAVLRVAPDLAPVVDRLTADHHRLGELLDALVAAVGALPGSAQQRAAAQEAVRALAAHLAAHLDLEEQHIIPQLSRLPGWV